MKKTIPEIREREENEKIHSHNSGIGINIAQLCVKEERDFTG